MVECYFCGKTIDSSSADTTYNYGSAHYDCNSIMEQRLKEGICIKCGDRWIAVEKFNQCEKCNDGSKYLDYPNQ